MLSLLVTSVTMSILVLLLLVLFSRLPSLISAKAKYVVLIVILIGLVIPFRPVLGSGLITVEQPMWVMPDEAQQMENSRTISGEVDGQVSANQVTVQAKQAAQSSQMVVFALWGIGVIATFGWHMRKHYKFRSMIRRWSKPVMDKNTLTVFQHTKTGMGISDQKIDLLTCSFIATPMLTGIIRPCILLPDQPMADDELHLVLKHELTHYQHKDLLIKLLGIVAISIHWFNPIVYLCCMAVETYGEACCDEAVLRDESVDYRHFYGEVIIAVAGSGSKMRTALSTCFYGGKRNMKRRLYTIMDAKQKKKKLSAAAVGVAIAMTLLSGSLVVFATANPALISLEKAKSIALADAGLTENEVTFVKAKLDRDGRQHEYDIEFYSGNINCDYEINAATGKIVKRDRDMEYHNHFSVKSTDSLSANDVAFYSSNSEYNNELDATNGSTWSYDYNTGHHAKHSTKSHHSASSTYIGEIQAKSIALNHAGLSESSVSYVKVKLDNDDGTPVYEVEFYYNGGEYEYEINAQTGAIREWDIDHD